MYFCRCNTPTFYALPLLDTKSLGLSVLNRMPDARDKQDGRCISIKRGHGLIMWRHNMGSRWRHTMSYMTSEAEARHMRHDAACQTSHGIRWGMPLPDCLASKPPRLPAVHSLQRKNTLSSASHYHPFFRVSKTATPLRTVRAASEDCVLLCCASVSWKSFLSACEPSSKCCLQLQGWCPK